MTNFLSDYLHLASENECPDEYHLFSALAVVSAAISRKVWIEMGIITTYANIYTILVGGAGCGKSTAMSIARSMIIAIGDIPMSADSETPQAFMRYLSGSITAKGERINDGCMKTWALSDGGIYTYYPCAIIVEEFAHFIGHDPFGWVLKLVDAYSNEAINIRTKNKGDDLIRGPYITILGCMTPETTKSMLKESIITTGFGRRTIFVWASGRTKIVPRPRKTPSMIEAGLRCIEWCRKLQKVFGEFKLSDETNAWWDDWYTNVFKPSLTTNTDASISAYLESKSEQLKKVAMLLCLSESLELNLKVDHFERALILLEANEKNLPRVFEGTGRNLSAPVAARIMSLVNASRGGPIKRKRIERDVWADATRGKEEIDAVIRALVDQEKLKVFHIPPDAVTQWLATPEAYQNHQDDVKTRLASLPSPAVDPQAGTLPPSTSLD